MSLFLILDPLPYPVEEYPSFSGIEEAIPAVSFTDLLSVAPRWRGVNPVAGEKIWPLRIHLARVISHNDRDISNDAYATLVSIRL
jgi:hypothetical protein